MTNGDQALYDANWLPAGEEPHPLGSITHYSVLRHGAISVLSLHSGDIDAETEVSTGMYVRDTRHLSKLRLSFGGVQPILLDARTPETALSAIFTNPAIRAPGGEVIPAQTLVVRRKRVIAESLLESLSVSNYAAVSVKLELRLEFEADFHDIFEVRGYERTSPAQPVVAEVRDGCVHFSYLGADNRKRTTVVSFLIPPTNLTTNSATIRLEMEPRETSEFLIEVSADQEPTNEHVDVARARVQQEQRQWLDESTQIRTSHDAINDMFDRSLLDVQALVTTTGEDQYLAAGVPWFDSLFGRDSLIAGMEIVAFAPDILRTALLVLAKYQADTTDPLHDATPGKIPHELRWGELAASGEVPFGQYYGSVDVTPLYIMAAAEYVRWTGDHVTLRTIWPNIQRAMAWCREQMRTGVEGFLSYSRLSVGGLENQGWKDSHDAIVWPDGRLVRPPIALVEVQGYMGAALGAYANMAAALGDPGAAEAAQEAPRFCKRVDDYFGDRDLGYVLCLDGAGAPVPTAASNAGHMLWAGVARKDLAEAAGERLLLPDMFSGWGVRTLGSMVGGYNPLGYHVGSVWPHDNALLMAGLRWYGFDDLAKRLGDALIQMALSFDEYRVPELMSGDARELRLVPTPYPVASRPQAWSAASLPYVLASLLGLRPGKPGQLCIVRPMLPEGVDWLQVRRLRFGGGLLDLMFRKQARHVSVEVEHLHGGVEVVLSQQAPNEILLRRD